MTTTVAIKEDTMEMLKAVREQLHATSFDEVIRKLILEKKKLKKSYFGAFPGLGEFQREEIDRFA